MELIPPKISSISAMLSPGLLRFAIESTMLDRGGSGNVRELVVEKERGTRSIVRQVEHIGREKSRRCKN